MKVKSILILALTTAFVTNNLCAEPEQEKGRSQIKENENEKTIIEIQKLITRKPTGSLGTAFYKPSEKETAFFKKLSEDEIKTGSMLEDADYSILDKTGKYISWFGIVRQINKPKDKSNRLNYLLIEHKYFDGLTDTHIQALSYNGAGDFIIETTNSIDDIEELMLIRVYGKVIKEDKKIPILRAEYIRCWPWGEFTFIGAYGKQKGNTEWKKGIIVKNNPWEQGPGIDVYRPYPNNTYYEKLLGKRKQVSAVEESDIKDIIKDIKITPELQTKIDELIKQLSNDEWENRKKAQDELIKIGKPSLVILNKIIDKTDDPEIKYRGNLIVRMILN